MNRNLLLVAISMLTWGLGEGFFIYFQPLYLQQWGASSIEIGTIIGGVGVVLALSQIPTGLLTDRFGPRVILWASWIIGLIAAWIMVLAPSLKVFIAGYLAYAMTGFGIIPVNTYITNARGNLSVGRSLTFISGMYNLGSVVGPILGGRIADRWGLHTIYIVAAIIFIFSTILVLFIQKVDDVHPSDIKIHQEATSRLWKNPKFLIFLGTAFFTALMLYFPQPLTSNFLQNEKHLSNSAIGLLGAVGSFGNAFATLVLGSLSPMTGMFIGQFMVAGFAAAFLWGNSSVWFGLGYFFFGGFRLFRSMSQAYARPWAKPGEMGLLFGALETTASIAIIIAPIIAGFLYARDPYLIYHYALYGILAILIVNIIVMKYVFPRVKEEKNHAAG